MTNMLVYTEIYLHKKSSVSSEHLEMLERKSRVFVLRWEL